MKQFYGKKEKKIKNNSLYNKDILLQNLLETKSHFGNSLQKTNPKSFDYLIGLRSKYCIIDLEHTISSIQRSFLVIEKALNDSNTRTKILVICNDSKTSHIVNKLNNQKVKNRMVFVTDKWSNGFLTNKKVSKEQFLKNYVLIVSFTSNQDNSLSNEAKKFKIPLISVCNTDVNPDLIDYPIMINHNNIKSTYFLISLFCKHFNNFKKYATK